MAFLSLPTPKNTGEAASRPRCGMPPTAPNGISGLSVNLQSRNMAPCSGTFGSGRIDWLYTGMGQIDLVMTPVGGFRLAVGEDILDRFVTRRVEVARNRFLINATRCGVDPIRARNQLLHWKRPWYRASRDASEVYYANQLEEIRANERQWPRHRDPLMVP